MAQRIYLVTIDWPEGPEIYPFGDLDDAIEWSQALLDDPGLQGLADNMLYIDREGVVMGTKANDDRFWRKILKQIENEEYGS